MNPVSVIRRIFESNPAARPFFGGVEGLERKLVESSPETLRTLASDLTSAGARATPKQAELLARLYVELGRIDEVGGRTAVLAMVALMPKTWADGQIKKLRQLAGWDRPDAKATARQVTFLASLEKRVTGSVTPYRQLTALTFEEADARIRLLRDELAAEKAAAPVIDLFSRRAI